jgi:hypothetical protein
MVQIIKKCLGITLVETWQLNIPGRNVTQKNNEEQEMVLVIDTSVSRKD